MAVPTSTKILEFTPSQEEAVVSRVLVMVHQAIDESFPGVEKAGRQFTKTVFSPDSESESTALSSPPVEAFGTDEKTSPDGKAPADGPPAFVPPPPQRAPAAERGGPAKASQPTPSAAASPAASQPASRARGQQTGVPVAATGNGDTTMMGAATGGADWQTRLTLALFIAGVVLLVYAILA